MPLAVALTAVAVVYAALQNLIGWEPSSAIASAPAISAPFAPDVAAKSQSPSVPANEQPSSRSPAPQGSLGRYADGSYAGDAADAFYGTVQVQAIIRDGKIADVQFLQYPNDRSNSRLINGQAVPLLTQEAVRVQNAQVNGVSGATFTSDAFRESLASALAPAKK